MQKNFNVNAHVNIFSKSVTLTFGHSSSKMMSSGLFPYSSNIN